jgi:hypothetical protein
MSAGSRRDLETDELNKCFAELRNRQRKLHDIVLHIIYAGTCSQAEHDAQCLAFLKEEQISLFVDQTAILNVIKNNNSICFKTLRLPH